MSSEQVRILIRLQPEMEFYSVPANEVPADHVRIHLVDHGEFYASPGLLKTVAERQGYAHPEFSPEVRERFCRFKRVFDQVYSQTIEQWEQGFRRDAHPWSEMAIWDAWADAIERFTAHLTDADEITQDKRNEVASLVMSLGKMPSENVKAIQNGGARISGLRTLSNRRIREIATWMFSDERAKERNARREQLRILIQGKALPGPDRVAIDALFDVPGTGQNRDAKFDPTDLINAADVILGVSRENGHEFLMYGRELLERIANTGMEAPENVLRIEMDQESDDLEKLAALIEVLKGRHDYDTDD
jgi:hypothetical protein